MDIEFEENILRILTIYETASITEKKELNPVGINRKEAQEIAHRNNLELTIFQNPEYGTIFKFQKRN